MASLAAACGSCAASFLIRLKDSCLGAAAVVCGCRHLAEDPGALCAGLRLPLPRSLLLLHLPVSAAGCPQVGVGHAVTSCCQGGRRVGGVGRSVRAALAEEEDGQQGSRVMGAAGVPGWRAALACCQPSRSAGRLRRRAYLPPGRAASALASAPAPPCPLPQPGLHCKLRHAPCPLPTPVQLQRTCFAIFPLTSFTVAFPAPNPTEICALLTAPTLRRSAPSFTAPTPAPPCVATTR